MQDLMKNCLIEINLQEDFSNIIKFLFSKIREEVICMINNSDPEIGTNNIMQLSKEIALLIISINNELNDNITEDLCKNIFKDPGLADKI